MSFEEITLKFFNGDVDKCLEHLARESFYKNYELTGSGPELQSILDQLNRENGKKFMKYFRKLVYKDPYTFSSYFENAKKESASCSTLSYDQVENAPVDDYKKKFMKDFLKFILSATGLIAITILAQNFGVDSLLSRVGSTGLKAYSALVAVDMGANLINYFKYKKNNKENVNDVQKGGRGL